MLPLLETDALVVTLTGTSFLSAARSCSLRGADGTVVATAADTTGGMRRLDRALLSFGRGRYEWTVRDAADHRLFQVVKPKTSLRGFRPEVSFADGTLLGLAVPVRGTTPVNGASFQGPDGTVLGELVPALGERKSRPVLMYRVREEDGTDVGEVARQTEGDWGYHLTFGPDADLAVRALTIAWTLCLLVQGSTVASS